MNFKMNDRTWEIKEVSQEDMRKALTDRYEKPELNSQYFGLTCEDTQTIFLDKNICYETKKRTLRHELAHCYIAMYCFHSQDNFTSEDMADLIENASEIIEDIVFNYFQTLSI